LNLYFESGKRGKISGGIRGESGKRENFFLFNFFSKCQNDESVTR